MKINRNCLLSFAFFDKRERHIIFEWIKTLSNVIMQQIGQGRSPSLCAAWCKAVKTWLRCKSLISLTTTQKCPPFATQVGIINSLDAQCIKI